jgi:uncharacterized ubiquitin-like protein YukD
MSAIKVVANVRGKKYDIQAETIEEFSTQVEKLAGISVDQQNVLFRGKVLNSAGKLTDLGITAGEVLNVVKGKKQTRTPTAEQVSASINADTGDSLPPMGPGEDNPFKDMDPAQLAEANKRMDEYLNSDAFLEQFADDEKLEQARQELLKNMDKYEQMIPGFSEQAKEIVNDPEKWREAMNNAKNQLLKIRDMRNQAKGATGEGLSDSSR